jgi:CBS domain containing-hemolysin-like protein
MEKLILLSLTVILGSAFFSMTEAALFSVSLNDARVLKEQKRRGSFSLVEIKERMHRPITTIVIFNNVFNIVGSMMVGLTVIKLFGSNWFGLTSACFTFLIILFSEILPKNIGDLYAVPIALFSAKPILLITRMLAPLIWFIQIFTRPFGNKVKDISEDEIKILSHLSHMEGNIEADEKEMIQKIFKLNDLAARDVMTPRTVVEALDGEEKLFNLKEKIQSLTHSRLPVYCGGLDDIIGICHQRDLLIALSRNEDKKIKDFVKTNLSLFVSEDIKIDQLIPLFQKQKTHLAIVNDEFNGTAGIITLEDVLEQIVGEIVDETDQDVDLREKAKELKAENTFH